MASKGDFYEVTDAIHDRGKMLKDSRRTIGKKDDPVDGLIRVAAALVGFVSEAIHYRQEKKESNCSESIYKYRHSNDTIVPEQTNKAIWQQADAEREAVALDTDATPLKEPSDLGNAFLKRYPFHPNTSRQVRIQLPVVVPQRRPKNRARGFIRAYSPVLADADIDQTTFHDFIDTFNKALEPNPYLFALNLAALAGMAAPEPFTLLISVAVSFATDATMEVQSRHKSNKFLDRINAKFFIPRGLVCLVATWRPEASGDDQILTTVDFDGRVVDETPPSAGLITKIENIMMQKTSSDEIIRKFRKQAQRKMKRSDGAFHWPEPAPLIFPSSEQTAIALGTRSNGKKKNAVDRGEIWLDDFMDKRAQAKWIQKNPTMTFASSLPKHDFRSRYADPNHPASSGDIIAFCTGGQWSTRGKVAVGEYLEYEGDDQEKLKSEDWKESKGKSSSPKDGGGQGLTSGFMNFLQKDMMYLMIVNLPSDIEITEALNSS